MCHIAAQCNCRAGRQRGARWWIRTPLREQMRSWRGQNERLEAQDAMRDRRRMPDAVRVEIDDAGRRVSREPPRGIGSTMAVFGKFDVASMKILLAQDIRAQGSDGSDGRLCRCRGL